MTTFEKIKKLLEENKVTYECFTHEPVRTSEEASRVRPGIDMSQGAKALVLKVKLRGNESRFIMVVLAGDKRFDSTKLKTLLDLKENRFASELEVVEITGTLPGGVPPFGNLFNIDVYMDNSLVGKEKIAFNAGDRSISVIMKLQDYIHIVDPKIVDIT